MGRAVWLVFALAACVAADAGSKPVVSHVFADLDFLAKGFQNVNQNFTDGAEVERYIATWVDGYVSLVQRTLGLADGARRKRDLSALTRDPAGVYMLRGLTERFNIPAKSPNDLALFSRTEGPGVTAWYAVALEADGPIPHMQLANTLVLYKLVGNRFLEATRVGVRGAVDVEVTQISGWTYVLAAEKEAGRSGLPLEGSVLYRMSQDGLKLIPVETLYAKNPSDLFFWNENADRYLGVACEFTVEDGAVRYSTRSLVYKWLGEHLDIVYSIPTHGARSIISFAVDSSRFLAVANHMNDRGETEIDSEIFKFNLDGNKWVSYQKLRTHGATDIKFFSLDRSKGQDHFLLVANQYNRAVDGSRIYATNSVVYKWTEGYFIPFQSFQITSAVKWLPYTGPRGELVLMVASLDYGLRVFQYDGWRFQEVRVLSPSGITGPGISNMRAYDIGASPVVAFANKRSDGTQTNVLGLDFSHNNELSQLHADTQLWCGQALDRIASQLGDLEARVNQAPKWTSPEVTVTGTLTFLSNSTVQRLSASKLKSRRLVFDAPYISALNRLQTDLSQRQAELVAARRTVSEALKKDSVNVVNGKVVLKSANIRCQSGCKLSSVHMGVLNEEDVGMLVRNTIKLNEEIQAKHLRFANVVVPGNLNARVVNDQDPSALVNKLTTKHLSGSVVVNGMVEVTGGLEVLGRVDGVRFKTDSILLSDGDQTLPGYMRADRLQVGNLEVQGRVSGMQLDLSSSVLPTEVLTQWNLGRLESLNVSAVQLSVDELSGVRLSEVLQHALRTNEPQQTVPGVHSFSSLLARHVVSGGPVSGVPVEKGIVRVDGKQVIPGAVLFSKPLIAGRVQVYKRLNNIGVAQDSSMDLLLAHYNTTQVVVSAKYIDTVTVVKKARVHGRVLGLDPLDEQPSVQVIKEDITLNGDVVVSGSVELVGPLLTDDFVDTSTGLSLQHVAKHGLRLDSSEIPNLTLDGAVTVGNVKADWVNGIRPESWVIDSPDVVVDLSGKTTFSGSLAVEVSSTLGGTVNGVNLVTLDQQALRLSGDQVITGHKSFATINVTGAWSNDTVLQTVRWRDIVSLHTGQTKEVTRIEKDLTVNGPLVAYKVRADGLFGGQEVSHMLSDSVFTDGSAFVISGPKTFTRALSVSHLSVLPTATGTNVSGLTPPADPTHTTFEDTITITNPLSVGSLIYQGNLDGVSHEDWSSEWLLKDGDQTIPGIQTVAGTVYANGGVHLATTINDLNLKVFAESVARIDDPNLSMGAVVFEDTVISNGQTTVGGTLGNVRLEDALLRRSVKPQVVSGRFVMGGGLRVDGDLKVDELVSGEDFKNLCAFTQGPLNAGAQRVTIKGNLHVDREITITETVNGRSLEKMRSETWMRDRPTLISAEMEFEDLNLTSIVVVQDRIDGVHLASLSMHYVSLNSDQTISTPLNVLGGVVVEDKLVAGVSAVDVEGDVGPINLPRFVSGVLLDGPDQDVPARMEFDVLHTTNHMSVSGTVNGLNLATDVVLLDRTNVITAKKVVDSAFVTSLNIEPNVLVQGVDVDAWSKTAVRTQGDFLVRGLKRFYHPHSSSDIRVHGMANGVPFNTDSILLRQGDQVVRGAKTLDLTGSSRALTVHSLEVRGLLNDVNMRDLMEKLAFKTSDLLFLSPLEFKAPIQVGAVTVDDLYQKKNVSELIWLANNPLVLEQYRKQHDLLQLSAEHVQQSLRAQGYYLNYFHMAVSLRSGVLAVLPLSVSGDPAAAIAVIRAAKPGEVHDVQFFHWDSASGTLKTHSSLASVSLPPSLRLVQPAVWGGQSAIYWEADESGRPDVGMHLGHVMGLMRDGRLGLAQVLRETHASAWVSVVELGALPCLVRGSPGGPAGKDGFCVLHCSSPSLSTPVQQVLNAVRPTHATALPVLGVPHVFLASAGSERSEGGVDVLRWNGNSLELTQTLGVVNATAVAAVLYRGVHYLAAASGRIDDVPHSGMVHISRYDSASGTFAHWVTLEVEAPVKLQFATLPSGELALYVVTECPTEGLVVFLYRGIAGFSRQTTTGAVPLGSLLSAFTTANHEHLVAISGAEGNRAALLQAAFKGRWTRK